MEIYTKNGSSAKKLHRNFKEHGDASNQARWLHIFKSVHIDFGRRIQTNWLKYEINIVEVQKIFITDDPKEMQQMLTEKYQNKETKIMKKTFQNKLITINGE